jgi:hypothetical protein
MEDLQQYSDIRRDYKKLLKERETYVAQEANPIVKPEKKTTTTLSEGYTYPKVGRAFQLSPHKDGEHPQYTGNITQSTWKNLQPRK